MNSKYKIEHYKEKYAHLLGQRVGKLKIVAFSNKVHCRNGIYLVCQCDCGNVAEVLKVRLSARSVKSCGCLNKEKGKNQNQFARVQ